MFGKILAMILVLFVVFIQAQTYEEQLDIMNPTADKVNIGGMLNDICKILYGDEVLTTAPSLVAGTTDTAEVRLNATIYSWFNGAVNPVVAAEVAFTATTHDCDSSKYATYRVEVNASDSLIITMSGSNTEYATRDSAITNLSARTADYVSLGYVLVYASGNLFNATTTKLNATATITVWYVPETVYVIDLD